ncbi:MAG: ATP phosphoribosyltransferase [Candidatus Marinimicrobia bacterium]|jgi:ATP phosphoribosyltransferase|nr:ATP phosphoribosyltransferase [Candidatus Neomarinimicrobiota bacterium]MBT3936806.1 ATP phosphoribosyltransferase [Candidatus Neomarinimicrobiota bacterium]MBT3961999.1 ATP phosphoribosyltransferase [Candidatus Neomarinimicrobiota bacterium]MBT4383689.1 ATP phosphoribosyltransferase [Candidatus Neomarinimicrobiota bacterium]MBT4637164.1 ATP phosphoribosyltransferase [Candidatus Neomarinimicrobiota bacterium]|tara:strand:+ start:588 stop:1463 length:876 start_codon:yes stop_codon:yes gene_type:complete
MKNNLKVGLPKGSLQETTLKLLKKAGWNFNLSSRAYKPYCDDNELEAWLIRAQEMSVYVEQGIFDMGITGKDWIEENNSNVVEVCELIYAKSYMRPVRWVLAVPNNSNIQSVKDLEGKRISTEVVNITKKYLKENNVDAHVEFSWGATEVKPGILVDAIVEVTETGSSLKANNLRIADTIMESSTRLVANKTAYKDPWKKKKIDNIAMLLQSSINATARVGLKMNVSTDQLESLVSVLPAMKKPTISQLTNGSGSAVEIIVEEKIVRDFIPLLIENGATDIIEYPLNKVII